ncbi:MAG TPA: nucleotide sugar dehydrogenase [Elusimicrobiales bacterium]|nr:nucleotide sugar dehydrogenase [Elusimicrobiales bacterium]
MEKLKDLISSKKAKVGIIGMGYVGLPLAVEFAKNGMQCMGFEIDKVRVKKLNKGISYIDDISSKEIKPLVKSKKLKASSEFGGLKLCDVLIICVPTPLRKTKDPDVTYIIDAARKISQNLRKNQLIVLESTTYPGTTKELIQPIFESGRLKCGRDFCLAFSPERVDPGNQKYNISNTPKVVGGITKTCTALAKLLYGNIVDEVIAVSSTQAAELVKLVENTFRAVNIALVNEMALMCDKLKINVWEVLSAAKSKPFGYMPFYPGPGIGGHCIPLDPHYLGWKMRSLDFDPRFIELADEINSYMPQYVVYKLAEILNRHKKALSETKLLVLGVAYKPDISDERESPAVDVITLLQNTGAKVDYFDPHVKKLELEDRFLTSKKLTARRLKKYDCVVIITAHSSVDYKWLVENSKLVFDTRNATRKIKSKKIYKL